MKSWIVKHTNAAGIRTRLPVIAASNKLAAAWAEQLRGPGVCSVINASRLAERMAA